MIELGGADIKIKFLTCQIKNLLAKMPIFTIVHERFRIEPPNLDELIRFFKRDFCR